MSVVNDILLGLLVTAACILAAVVLQRTYAQTSEWIKSRVEARRINKMLNGNERLLHMVALQQHLFRSAPEFIRLPDSAQRLLLSNISYHVIAREGMPWDMAQTMMFVQSIQEDPEMLAFAEAAMEGATFEDALEVAEEVRKKREEDQDGMA